MASALSSYAFDAVNYVLAFAEGFVLTALFVVFLLVARAAELRDVEAQALVLRDAVEGGNDGFVISQTSRPLSRRTVDDVEDRRRRRFALDAAASQRRGSRVPRRMRVADVLRGLLH